MERDVHGWASAAPTQESQGNIHVEQIREKEGKAQRTKKGGSSQIYGKGTEKGISWLE